MTNKLVPEQELCAGRGRGRGGRPARPRHAEGAAPQVTASDQAKPCRTLTPISRPFPGVHFPPGSPAGSWVGGTHSGLIHRATARSEQQPCGRRDVHTCTLHTSSHPAAGFTGRMVWGVVGAPTGSVPIQVGARGLSSVCRWAWPPPPSPHRALRPSQRAAMGPSTSHTSPGSAVLTPHATR